MKHVLTSNDTSIAILDDLAGTEDLADMFLDDEEIEYVDSDDDNEENDDDEHQAFLQVMMKIKLNSINLQVFTI